MSSKKSDPQHLPSPERSETLISLTEEPPRSIRSLPQELVNEVLLSCHLHSDSPHPPLSRLLACVMMEIKELYPDPAGRPTVNEFLFRALEDYVLGLHRQHRDTLRTTLHFSEFYR